MIEKIKDGFQKVGSYCVENPLRAIAVVAITCVSVWAICFIVRQIKKTIR